MDYKGVFVFLYMKVEGNKTALKDVQKKPHGVYNLGSGGGKRADSLKLEREDG